MIPLFAKMVLILTLIALSSFLPPSTTYTRATPSDNTVATVSYQADVMRVLNSNPSLLSDVPRLSSTTEGLSSLVPTEPRIEAPRGEPASIAAPEPVPGPAPGPAPVLDGAEPRPEPGILQ